MRWLLLGCMLLAHAHAADDEYWGEANRGWFWYELPPPPAPEPVPAPAPPVPDAEQEQQEQEMLPAPPPELAAHRRLQQRIEDRRAIAIMDPSPANVRAYLQAQQEALERAATFADVWQRVVWTTPELDYQLRGRPTNAAALPDWDAARLQRRERAVRDLAADHGLFFFFGHDCLSCAQMADTLREFARDHGFAVQAIALDGARHPAFPAAWPDNGFAERWGVRAVPALALANLTPQQERVLPLGHGPLAAAEIAERIEVLASIPVGARL